MDAIEPKTILVVDDDTVTLETTVRMLRHAGYDTLQAPDGREAIEMSRTHSDPIHVLLTDFVMPFFDGGKLPTSWRKRDQVLK